ncbi:MarR family transcriptional regulator [Sphingosinithalassobacter tenebrarum]|uniref:MarR family transcriptional regulator n=2 Tax=Stakelama tenebrarum TaxID=2711215 RepID=A0A6G6YAH9_9SPHN|nr:MarR family transcriptional regulator [Sphingosinithalassobacter tenebrarum]
MDNPKRVVALKLTILARQLGRRFDQSVENQGLSRAKFGVIAVVSRHPGATQRLIAEILEVTEVTAGRLIERLCQDGYLERRANEGDRRAHCVYLTPAATPVLERLGEIASEQENEAFEGISEDELEMLAGLLERMSANISEAREAERNAACG